MRVEVLLERNSDIIVHRDVVSVYWGDLGNTVTCYVANGDMHSYVIKNMTYIKQFGGWNVADDQTSRAS